jgi:hypothetical protein
MIIFEFSGKFTNLTERDKVFEILNAYLEGTWLVSRNGSKTQYVSLLSITMTKYLIRRKDLFWLMGIDVSVCGCLIPLSLGLR